MSFVALRNGVALGRVAAKEGVVKLPRRRFLHLAAGAAALPAVSRIAWAQTYPVRPITIVVPAAAGGPTDTIGRIVADHMRVQLGQPVVIENVAGAGGTIGAGRVARATPDGYTLSLGAFDVFVLNGAVYDLKYDLLNDFEPISLIADGPQLIVGKKAIPANDLKGLIEWLKANPDKASAGHPGTGGASHLMGLLFQQRTGTRFQHVPYRGAGPALQDVMSGQIDLMMTTATNSLPQIRAGTIKAYAVTAGRRLTSAPDIPTVDEAGLPGLYISVWFALFAPKGTPKDVIDVLNSGVMSALADPNVRTRLNDLGMEIPVGDQQTPAALGKLQKAEIDKWWPIIKAANIKGE